MAALAVASGGASFAASYQGISYSSTVARGKWTSSFSAAKAAATRENVPLVAIWVSKGCGFCRTFGYNLSKSAVDSWMKARQFYFVIGVDSSGEGDAVKSFVRNSSGQYPYSCVYWKKNSDGKKVEAKFTGRSGGAAMSNSKFRDLVDKYAQAGKYVKAHVLTVVSDVASCAVSGGGTYKTGKAVTLKAAAANGYVFSGWYLANKTLLSQSASYSYAMPGNAASVTGRFILKEKDWAKISYAMLPEYAKSAAMAEVAVTASGGSLPSVSFSGLPKGMKYSSGKVSGKPTKSGIYKVIGKARTAGEAVAMQTNSVVVRASGEYVVKVAVDSASAGRGTASGSGVYKKGKTVALKAKPKSGVVFAGWYDGAARASLATTYKYKVATRDVAFTAKFATKAEDRAAVALSVAGVSQMPGVLLTNTVARGVRLSWPVVHQAISANKVTVSGLPKGLKFKTSAQGGYVIAGMPTAVSSVNKKTKQRKPSIVTIKVKTAGNTVTYKLAIVVEPLPTWATGTFAGHASLGGVVGAASMTVSASGAISCKYVLNGATWKFSTTGYAADNAAAVATDRAFTIAATAKSGKSTRAMTVVVTPGWIAADGTSLLNHAYATGEDDVKTALDLRRIAWGDKGVAKVFKTGTYALDGDLAGVRARVASSGTVTFSGTLDGQKVSASAQVRLAPDGTCSANLVIPTTATARGRLESVLIPLRD